MVAGYIRNLIVNAVIKSSRVIDEKKNSLTINKNLNDCLRVIRWAIREKGFWGASIFKSLDRWIQCSVVLWWKSWKLNVLYGHRSSRTSYLQWTIKSNLPYYLSNQPQHGYCVVTLGFWSELIIARYLFLAFIFLPAYSWRQEASMVTCLTQLSQRVFFINNTSFFRMYLKLTYLSALT